MDNTFVTASNVKEMHGKIEEIEFVAKQGGFKYKEWVVSGQNVPEQVISVALPNAIGVNEEKALGVHWDVMQDKFFIKVDISIGSKKSIKKVPLLPNLEKADPLLFSKTEELEASPFYLESTEPTSSEVSLLFSKMDQISPSYFKKDQVLSSPDTGTKVSASQFLPIKLTLRICLSIRQSL